jgi:uncharacterized protein
VTSRTNGGLKAAVELCSAQLGIRVPAILLEGDEPSPKVQVDPEEKHPLEPKPSQPGPIKAGELPPAVGTCRLTILPRDPHCLYAHWDLTPEEQRGYSARAVDHHLTLRVRAEGAHGELAGELPVQPDAQHAFIPVSRADSPYCVELGFHQAKGGWISIASSSPTRTPPERPAQIQPIHFSSLPIREPTTEEWTPEHEQALAELMRLSYGPGAAKGQSEIAELLARHLEWEISSIAAAQAGLPAPPEAMVNLPSPWGGEWVTSPNPIETRGAQTAFWLNVNAELVVYGSTQPGAQLTIGGQPIRLRPDGTFSHRVALPDGAYELPVEAHSERGEVRQACLRFSRKTTYEGSVGTEGQGPTLSAPTGENAS